MKTYRELITLSTFDERFNYLLIGNGVGIETFGHNRYLNQDFYHSNEWKRFRRDMIVRDNGCEMGLDNYDIVGQIVLHHIEPLTILDFKDVAQALMNPDNVVCVSRKLHNAIHYGDKSVLEPLFYERRPGDTQLW